MSAPLPSRLLQLAKASCNIFGTTFNPQQLRTGNKILRQRLRGPALADYYPKRLKGIKEMRLMNPGIGFPDEFEDRRKVSVEKAKARNKGAPKKQRTKPEKKHGGKK